MRTTEYLKDFQKERKILTDQLEALDQAIAGLEHFKSLNGNAKVSSEPTTIKPKKHKVPCPDCRKRYLAGPGLAVHRKTQHGWDKDSGIDLYEEAMPDTRVGEVSAREIERTQ